MKVKNEKTITLTDKQLVNMLTEMFREQFIPTATVSVNFVTEAVRDVDGDIIYHTLKHVTISGIEEITLSKKS